MQTTSQASRLNTLAQSVGASPQPAGSFNGISAVLFTAPISPTDLTQYSDLTIATFAGSTPIVVTYTGPQEAPNRQPYMSTQLLNWICSAAPVTPQTCYGVAFFFPGSPNVLVGVDIFPVPVTITLAYDNITWIGTVP